MRLRAYTSAFGLSAVLALGFAGCPDDNGALQTDSCQQVMAIRCERTATCGGELALTSLGYASVSDCTKKLHDANCTKAQAACDPGTNCIESLRVQSCADFSSGVEPAACAYACIPGTAGTGGDGGGGGWGGDGGSGGWGGYGGWDGYGGGGGWGGYGGLGGYGGGGGWGGYGGWDGYGGNVVSSGGAGGGGVFGLAAVAACNDAVAAICERSFYCGGAPALAKLGYASLAACTAGMQTTNCAARAPCGPGATFDADQAKRCSDDIRTEPCVDFNNGVDPVACSLVCSGGGGGIGGYGYGGWGGDVGGNGGWGGDVGGNGGWGGAIGGYGGWGGAIGGFGGDVTGGGGWGGDLGGQSGQSGWPWTW
jgi:hypothetical protein